MITISEYAKSRGVSREAVRKQVQRYNDKLERHITKEGRTRYLDDIAVMFLDEHRAPKQIIIKPSDDETEAELKRLRAEVDTLRAELVKKQEHIIKLQDDKMQLLETKGKYDLLIDTKADLQKDLDKTKKALEDLTEEHEKTKAEAGSYIKSIFGLYKRVQNRAETPPKIDLNE